MPLKHIKAMVATTWIAAVGAVGVIADLGGPSSWILLGLGAIVPPLLMARYWHEPDQTMSESIQKALR